MIKTLEEVAEILNGVLPDKVVYRAWPVGEAPPLPFICYLADGSDNFAADNTVYLKGTTVRIELYTAAKDLTTESAIESALAAAALVWSRDDTYIDTERCYLTIYEVTIYG